ncbi:MAG: SufE family protein [Bacteroidales bacterium]|nr:SufE family protein [Bacteroidales bacterium]
MQTIQEIEQGLIEEFAMFDDWMDKYNYIIELGKELPLIEEQHKTADFLIEGCQSQVWLHPDFHDGRIFFTADSDAIITKGIVNLLVRVFSGRTPQEILDDDLTYLDAIGLKEHLSPTRSNGLASMVKQLKLYAMAFQKMENAE